METNQLTDPYKHEVRKSGDAVLSKEWNVFGGKLERINAKFNETDSLVSGELKIEGVLTTQDELVAEKQLKVKENLEVDGVATFKSTVKIPHAKLGVGTTADPKGTLEIKSDKHGKLGGTLSISNYGGGKDASVAVDFRTQQSGTTPTSRILAKDSDQYSNSILFQVKKPGNVGNPLQTKMSLSDEEIFLGSATKINGALDVFGPTKINNALEINATTKINGALDVNSTLKLKSSSVNILTLQTTDNKAISTYWYDKDNKVRAWMGLDNDLDTFLFATANGTKEISFYAPTKIKGALEVNSTLKLKDGSVNILTLQTTNNNSIFTYWYDKDNKVRAWMGLDNDLDTFLFATANDTKEISFYAPTKIKNTLEVNSRLKLKSNVDNILSLQTTDNRNLYTYWYDKDNKIRAWMGLDNDLDTFLLSTANGTKEISFHSPTKINGSLEVSSSTKIKGALEVNSILKLKGSSTNILTLQTTDNNSIFTYWYDKDNKVRAWMGLDNDLDTFLLYTTNGTKKISLGSTKITGPLEVSSSTKINGSLEVNSTLKIKGGINGLLTLQTTDNRYLYTQWYDKDNKRRVWMGLDDDLDAFYISPENGTNKIVLNKETKITGTLNLPSSIKIGQWEIRASGANLTFYHNSKAVGRFSSGHDRFHVYRNINGSRPYFYVNQNGGYGMYNG